MNTLPKFPDLTVYDELEPCPYLSDQTARLPLQVPRSTVTPDETDRRLELGQRRTGEFVYSTQCPNCNACLPIRLRPNRLVESRTHLRTLRKNDKLLEVRVGPVRVDQDRIDLFNQHRQQRGLGHGEARIDAEEYAWAFQRSCFDTFEFSYWLDSRLVCVAICDQGFNSLSAVYTYYDTRHLELGLGTYSILKQLEYCRRTSREFLYLGFYIGRSSHMAYKARFLPNERLEHGRWVEYRRDKAED